MSQESEKLPKGLIAWFATNHVAANILMAVLVIGGIVSVGAMRSETFPTIDPKLITISVVYPGATPYEVAESITSRVEEALVGIEGVKRISSQAAEGLGVTSVELEDFIDGDTVLTDVESAVDSILEFPPEDAERPIVKKLRVTPNVMSLAVHGQVSEAVLKNTTESIEDDLQRLSGVASTATRGLRDHEISVEVSESALQTYGLSLQEVGNAIQRFSQDIPAGTIESGQGDILLRVQEKKITGEGFANIPVGVDTSGAILKVKDIGKVIDGFEDVNIESRFNGEKAAFIDVKRSDTSDTLAVAEQVKTYLQKANLPEGLSLSVQKDETQVLRDRISLMMRNAIIGFVLVFLILLLFLDLKLAFWVSAAIPISFLGGLMLIHFMGYSINMISLFALIVVLGIVVDDGIVTGESIYEAQQKSGKSIKATVKGVKSIMAPVVIGVTTTMAAFAPLIFSTGVLGQIIGIVPVVVISILFISLIEAFMILPAHLSQPTSWSKGVMAVARDAVGKKLQTFTESRLVPAVAWCIRWRYATCAAFVAFLMVTFAMVSSGVVRFIFFPQIEGDEITIDVTMPQGTAFTVTEDTLSKIENAVFEVENENDTGTKLFTSVSVSIGERNGSGNPLSGSGGSKANNIGQVKIQLISPDERRLGSGAIENLIRDKIEDYPNIEKLGFQSSPVGEEADIELELSHPDDQVLESAAEDLKERIAGLNGTQEVADSFQEGKLQYSLSLTDEGLAVGLSPAELGRQLRAGFFGLEVQRFQRGRSEVVTYVRYPKSVRENLAALQSLRVRLPDGSEVPLEDVAKIEQTQGYSEIQTVNGRRIVRITADVDISITTPNVVIGKLQNEILPEFANQYPSLSYSFEGESREQKEDLQSLVRNMMIALLLIYMLLGGQLRSYIQPLVIMCAIPFGMVGAIWGHIILGYDLTFISLFGIVALMGVVVNDSVVLVDYLNGHWRNDKTIEEAALRAVRRRFRPILLTTLSTVLGLLPMLLETSLQARFLIPMVVSLTSGLLFSSVVILFLLPCLLNIVEDVRHLVKRGFQLFLRRSSLGSGGQ